MTAPQIVTVYSDYKSPYAYLAKDLAYELEQDHPDPAELASLHPGHPQLPRICPGRCRWSGS